MGVGDLSNRLSLRSEDIAVILLRDKALDSHTRLLPKLSRRLSYITISIHAHNEHLAVKTILQEQCFCFSDREHWARVSPNVLYKYEVKITCTIQEQPISEAKNQ